MGAERPSHLAAKKNEQGRGYQGRKQSRSQAIKVASKPVQIYIYTQARKHIRRSSPQAFSFFFLNNDQVRKLKKKNKQARKLYPVPPPPQPKPFKFSPYIQGGKGRRGREIPHPIYAVLSSVLLFVLCFV